MRICSPCSGTSSQGTWNRWEQTLSGQNVLGTTALGGERGEALQHTTLFPLHIFMAMGCITGTGCSLGVRLSTDTQGREADLCARTGTSSQPMPAILGDGKPGFHPTLFPEDRNGWIEGQEADPVLLLGCVWEHSLQCWGAISRPGERGSCREKEGCLLRYRVHQPQAPR